MGDNTLFFSRVLMPFFDGRTDGTYSLAFQVSWVRSLPDGLGLHDLNGPLYVRLWEEISASNAISTK
jgi:hypothetical protein